MDSRCDEIEQIQHQMHLVRMSLGEGVHDLVAGARSATDWRQYWQRHPLAWGGAAAALGFLLVPARRAAASEVREIAEMAKAVVSAPKTPSATRRIMAELAGMAIGFVAQRGLQFLGQHLESVFAQHFDSGGAATPEEWETQGKEKEARRRAASEKRTRPNGPPRKGNRPDYE